MGEPLVSTVIPSYNYGHFVTEAVESALAQTYPNQEILVIDDGSTDDTRERLAPYMDRIRYIYQTNRGLSASRNVGIRQAKGEWIAFLDADDVWHPRKLEVQLKAARGMGGPGLIGAPKATRLASQLPDDPEIQPLGVRDFLLGLPLTPSSVLVHRACFEAAGLFDETLSGTEDRDMWLRLAVRYPAAVVHSDCCMYRYHGDQLSRRAHNTYRNYRVVLDKFFSEYYEYLSYVGLAYSYLYFDAAWAFKGEGRRIEALQFLARSLLRRPWAMGGTRTRFPRLKLLLRLAVGERPFSLLTSSRGV